MTERLDACVARDYTTRDGQQKTAWTRIGAAFASKNGGGYMVVLDIPPPASLDRDGKQVQYRFHLMTPRPRDDRGGGGGGERATRGGYEDADYAPPKDDSEIPF